MFCFEGENLLPKFYPTSKNGCEISAYSMLCKGVMLALFSNCRKLSMLVKNVTNMKYCISRNFAGFLFFANFES